MTDRPPRLLVALSPHGYGHGAMTAPLVAALRRRRPELDLTLQTGLPRDWLRSRYAEPFTLVPEIPDFGACMNGPLAVDVEATARRYQALHRDLDAVIAGEAQRLRRLEVDLVLSNVSYVMLAAAARAGIAAVGFSCLTWSEIYEGVCGGRPEAPGILAEMRACYAAADLFIRTVPATPMPGLPRRLDVGPVAARVPSRRGELAVRLGLAPGEKLGLIGFGGVGLDLPFAAWARLPGWRWIAPERVPERPDMTYWGDFDTGFSALLASVDVVVTKPGYGTFSECAVHGVPVLHLERRDWVETEHLVRWLHAHDRALEIAPADLFSPRLGEQLQALFAIPDKPLVEPTGVQQATDAVLDMLDGAVCRRR